MKNVTRSTFLLFSLLLLCWTAQGQSAGGPDKKLVLDSGVAAHRGLDAVYGKFSEGYLKLDPKLVGGLYTQSASYLVPGQNIKNGRGSIEADFASFFDSVRKDNGKLDISFRITQRKVDRTLAYDVGIYTLTSTDAKGKSSIGRGKFVVVAVKEKGDIWRFQVDGYSDLPAEK